MIIVLVAFLFAFILVMVEVLVDVQINNLEKKVQNFINVAKLSDVRSDVRITAN